VESYIAKAVITVMVVQHFAGISMPLGGIIHLVSLMNKKGYMPTAEEIRAFSQSMVNNPPLKPFAGFVENANYFDDMLKAASSQSPPQAGAAAKAEKN
jgi:hypothetical protein